MAKKKSKKTQDKFSLDPVREQLEKGEQLAGWIEAAYQHRAEFPPQVVLAVVGDYLVQWDTLGPDLAAAAEAVTQHREGLLEKAGGLREKAKEVEALVDELKLRHVIGELSADEFDAREKEARDGAGGGDLGNIETSIADVDAVLDSVGGVQARLAEASRRLEDLRAGGDGATAPAPEAAPAADAPADAPPEPDLAPPIPDGAVEDLAATADPAAPAEEWEVPPPPSEPVSDATPDAAPAASNAAGEPAAEAGDALPAWSPLGSPEGDGAGATGGEDLMSTGLITARPDLVGAEAPPVQPSAEFNAEAAKGEGPRLAVFSPDGKQETYPFGGEVMSMGRGRNNDIQIKNDGKISRYHCRIFRRGDEFIIEDNKSSNGTLVDSKLVTRQRLDGGEQIQIGETRVIFQL